MAEVFPSVTGKNLHKTVTTVPDDYTDKNLVVIVAFQQWHQNLVNQSIQVLQSAGIDQTHHVLELPVIKTSSMFRQMRLDGIMRAAFRDPITRTRTITLYLDKLKFRQNLNIPSEETIHWFVVEGASKAILARGEGAFRIQDLVHVKDE
ncbi:MAG: hypothetical protein ACJZ40_06465 [Candidatus Poseidoniaceae archaeon]|tara:strand:+ start:185 stop:631 length:447 start_codon:yes stop_codon:yes gene_type:complete